MAARAWVSGAATTPFGRREETLPELAGAAATAALRDAGLEAAAVGAVFVGAFTPGMFTGQEHLGALVAERVGVSVPAVRFEAACASGGMAFHLAAQAVEAGVHDAVLVVGVEKMTGLSAGEIASILLSASDTAAEGRVGLPFPAAFGLAARAHMAAHGTTRSQLDAVVVKAHANALANPHAQFHRAVTEEDLRAARPVADPLTLLDCAPISDGAAAVVVTRRPRDDRSVALLGAGAATDTLSLLRRPDITSFRATRMAAARAYESAGVRPVDIDVAEVHDCFSIAEIIATEDLGFFPAGAGGPAAAEGRTGLEGEVVVNPSGGLKAKGHPIGATGIAQIAACVQRLRGEDDRLGPVDLALTHNLGGFGTTAVVNVLGRVA